jgi:hypothetical protein
MSGEIVQHILDADEHPDHNEKHTERRETDDGTSFSFPKSEDETG